MKLIDIYKVKNKIKNKRFTINQEYFLVKKMNGVINIDDDSDDLKEHIVVKFVHIVKK